MLTDAGIFLLDLVHLTDVATAEQLLFISSPLHVEGCQPTVAELEEHPLKS